MIKITPKITTTKNKIIRKIYNDNGTLNLKSEYNRKTGKLLKDVFMNNEGTKPLRITLYDKNENVLKDSFFKATGEYLGTIDHSLIAEI